MEQSTPDVKKPVLLKDFAFLAIPIFFLGLLGGGVLVSNNGALLKDRDEWRKNAIEWMEAQKATERADSTVIHSLEDRLRERDRVWEKCLKEAQPGYTCSVPSDVKAIKK